MACSKCSDNYGSGPAFRVEIPLHPFNYVCDLRHVRTLLLTTIDSGSAGKNQPKLTEALELIENMLNCKPPMKERVLIPGPSIGSRVSKVRKVPIQQVKPATPAPEVKIFIKEERVPGRPHKHMKLRSGCKRGLCCLDLPADEDSLETAQAASTAHPVGAVKIEELEDDGPA